MKLVVGVLCLLGATALLYVGLRTQLKPVVPPAPAFAVDTPVKDFTEVEQLAELRYNFTFTNTHPVPVEVLAVMTSCGCTVAEVVPKTVPPGGTAELSSVWKVGLSQGHKSVNIGVTYSIGGGTPDWLYITQKAHVTPAASLSPGKLILVSGQESTNSVEAYVKNDVARILTASADPRFFEVSFGASRHLVSVRYNGSGVVEEDTTYNVIVRLENAPGDLILPVSFRKPTVQSTREGDTK